MSSTFQDVFGKANSSFIEYERASTGTGIGRDAHTIAHFVADQRLRALEEHCDEEPVPIDAWRHRAVVLVNYLDDHEIFLKMHSPVLVALSGKAAFGGTIHVEEYLAPGLPNTAARFLLFSSVFKRREHILSTASSPLDRPSSR